MVPQLLLCFIVLGFARVTRAESPMDYIKRCREVGKSTGAVAMGEGCREVKAKCMLAPEKLVRDSEGKTPPPNGRNFDETTMSSMSLAAQLEERVLVASCDFTLANACMVAATGAVFDGNDDQCREAFTKGPHPDAKPTCPNLWSVLQVFQGASIKACKKVIPTRGGSEANSGQENLG